MIPATTNFKTLLATKNLGGGILMATIWLVKRQDGTVLGFTDCNQDISYNLESFLSSISNTIPEVTGTGTVNYKAATGFTRSDIASADDLSVDNMELDGMITSPSITEDALQEGVWDAAFVLVAKVNPLDLTNSMGALVVRVGNLGEVTLERNTFKAEIRGRAQAYTRTIGELTQPGCRAELYDSRCKVNPASFTVTGTLTGVNADKVTMYDTSRSEAGPTGGVAVTAITNSNPGHVTLTDASTFFNNEPVTLSTCGGMPLLNTSTVIRNLSGNTFDLAIDTSNVAIYGTYSGGGNCTPMGGDSGYFDFGLMTMTSGAANGFSMEVRSYVPGQWILQLPFAGGLLTPTAGDSYSMKAGCDKSLSTCFNKFSNVINFRGEPYLPGVDKIVQVGKQG